MCVLECFICVWHNLLSTIDLTLLPSGCYLLGLKSWSTTLVLGRQWISEEVWGSIQFYAFFCAWNFWVVFCYLFLSLAWNCACQCTGTKRNGTTKWGLVLEYIILVSTVNQTVESATVSIRIFLIVFLHIGLKFTSDREDFLVYMYISQAWCSLGHTKEEKNWEINEIIYHLWPFPGLCLISDF